MRVATVGTKINSNQGLSTQRNELNSKNKNVSFTGPLGQLLMNAPVVSSHHINGPSLEVLAYVFIALIAIALCKNKS